MLVEFQKNDIGIRPRRHCIFGSDFLTAGPGGHENANVHPPFLAFEDTQRTGSNGIFQCLRNLCQARNTTVPDPETESIRHLADGGIQEMTDKKGVDREPGVDFTDLDGPVQRMQKIGPDEAHAIRPSGRTEEVLHLRTQRQDCLEAEVLEVVFHRYPQAPLHTAEDVAQAIHL